MAEYTTAQGDRFEIREGYVPDAESGRCRSCDALIVWTRTPNGKRMPVDPDGASHFATCPQAGQWRRR